MRSVLAAITLFIVSCLLAAAPVRADFDNEDSGWSRPQGVTTFDEPILIQYRSLDYFLFTLDKYMGMAGKQSRFLWGFAVEGSIAERGDVLIWRYSVSNHGLDGAYRECGEVEAQTDPAGKLINYKVIKVSRNCSTEALFLDSKDLRFPLPELPNRAVAMNDILESGCSPEESSEAGLEDCELARVVSGLILGEGRQLLLIEEQGSFKTAGTEGVMDGYTIVDIENGMIKKVLKKLNLQSVKGKIS